MSLRRVALAGRSTRLRRWIGAGLLLFAAVIVIPKTVSLLLVAIPRYLTVTPESYGAHFWSRKTSILIHVMVGSVAVASGPLQFWPWLRRRHREIHRFVGRMYVLSIAISGAAALWLGVRTEVSLGNTIGLILMGVAWLFTTGAGYFHGRARRAAAHALWMSRSYILTLAWVVFRVGQDQFGLTVMAWACWIAPLMLLEVSRYVVPSPWALAVHPRRAVTTK